MIATLSSMLRDDQGAAMVEYGLLIALIAIVAMVGVKVLGTNLSTLFSNVAASL
jgi:pilus assembly protein Flp/PilA